MSAGKIIGGCLAAAVLFHNDPAFAYQWGEVEINPLASVEEEYDSNITYAHSGVLSDFITSPRVGVEGTYTGKNSSADFKTSLEEQIYSKYSQYDNLSEYLFGNYQADYTYYDHLKLDDSFEHAEDPTTFAQQFGRSNGRYEYYENDLHAVWTHDFTSRFSVQYKISTDYYDPQLEGLQSSFQIKPGIEGDFALSDRLRLLAYDDFTNRDYSQYGDMFKDSVGMGLRNYWTPQLYLEAKAGEDFIQPIVGSDTSRPQYIVSLNDQRDQNTLYTLSYSKEYQDTPYSEFLFNNWQASLEVKKDLTARMSFYASAFTGGGVYVGEDLKEHLNGVGAGLIIHVTRNTDVRAEYRISDNSSNTEEDSYKKQTALLEITIKF